ncbi:hypothetical protein AVEN_155662-1 [Araneus ventricosus]|uniref:Uncharacterized protein n=1 Tax=Araneus ventricosus TaxID=182803 RepID=A0A4Y2VN18_ARAVE|nr:hypothetical protein AVEN_155662-1 [Araneus ventricosus]
MVHAACIIAVSSPPPRFRPKTRAQADDFLSDSKQRFLHSLQKFSGLLFSAKIGRESLRPITQVSSGQIRSDQIRAGPSLEHKPKILYRIRFPFIFTKSYLPIFKIFKSPPFSQNRVRVSASARVSPSACV